MTALFKQYTKEIHKERDYFAQWEPLDVPLRLGDYGTMESFRFNRIGNISEFGKINIKTRESPAIGMDYTTDKHVNITSTVGAKGTGANGKLNIDFDKKESIFMKLEKMTSIAIDNLDDVGDFVVDVYHRKGKDWKLEHVFVNQLYMSRRFLIAISKENDTKLTLSGKVSRIITQSVDIDLEDLTITATKGAMATYYNDRNLEKTPLFSLHQVKDPITAKAYHAPYK